MIARATLAVVLLFAFPAIADVNKTAQPIQDSTPQLDPSLDGKWQGVINFDKEAFLAKTSTPDTGVTFRIEVDDSVVRVFVQQDGSFEEAKPGRFHIAHVSTNAVIYATDEDLGIWVESWAFVVTKKDANTLIVEYTRLVNNVATPLSEEGSKFATRGAGEFKRVESPVGH